MAITTDVSGTTVQDLQGKSLDELLAMPVGSWLAPFVASHPVPVDRDRQVSAFCKLCRTRFWHRTKSGARTLLTEHRTDHCIEEPTP